MNKNEAVAAAQQDMDEAFSRAGGVRRNVTQQKDVLESAQVDMDAIFGHKAGPDVSAVAGMSGHDRINQLKESGTLTADSACDVDVDIACTDLREARFNDESGDLENVILIESGTNREKRRHYPDSTIREAAPHFAGLKMYLNHPSRAQERELPERDLRDWVSTIVESSYSGGKAMAKIAVHDPWLKSRLKDPIARKHIGLSILTGGMSRIGNIDGQEMEIVEQIVFSRKSGPVSVDWVTDAGARGRVA